MLIDDVALILDIVLLEGLERALSQRRVEPCTSRPNQLLEKRTCRVEARPILVLLLRVRESVVFPDFESVALNHRLVFTLSLALLAVLDSLRNRLALLLLLLLVQELHLLLIHLLVLVVELFEFVNIACWSGIKHFDVFVFLVPVPDHIIHEVEVDLGLGEGEVASVGDEHVVRSFGLDHAVYHLFQVIHLLFRVEVLVVFVEVDVVVVVLVEGESLRPAVIALLLGHDDGEDVLLAAEVVLVWPPDLDFVP